MNNSIREQLKRISYNVRPTVAQKFTYYPDLDFPENEFVIGPVKFSSYPVFGLRIYVPLDTYLVLNIEPEKRITREEGLLELPNLPVGEYQAYFVKKKHGRLCIPDVHARSSDSFDLKTGITVAWSVSNPKKITSAQNPFDQLQKQCVSALTSLLREYAHDEIIGTVDRPVKSTKWLEDLLLEKIQQDPCQFGISVNHIAIRSFSGDAKVLSRKHGQYFTKMDQQVVEAKIEIDKQKANAALYQETQRQRALAIESYQKNFSMEPARKQERAITAMKEISSMIESSMKSLTLSQAGYQQNLAAVSPEYSQAIISAVNAIHDLASTTPGSDQIDEIFENSFFQTATQMQGPLL